MVSYVIMVIFGLFLLGAIMSALFIGMILIMLCRVVHINEGKKYIVCILSKSHNGNHMSALGERF